MGRVRRVIVLGAGLAGLACALGVARAGVAVEVFDARAPTFEAPGTVDVVPNLLRDLEALGVGQACARAGFAYSRVAVTDSKGRALHDLPQQRLTSHQLPMALGMRHADLLQILGRAATEAGARLQLSRKAVALDAAGPQASVSFGDQTCAAADLVVVATGADSALRQQALGPAAPSRDLGQVWWHAFVPRTLGLDCPTWLIGQSRRALWIPVSATRAGLVLIAPVSANFHATGAAGMQQALCEFSALPASVLAGLGHEGASIAGRAVREGVLAQWFRGRALCVGEAAHALAPHFGQAAAQSVEDARVLGDLLQQDLALEPLLQRFSARRVPRARQVAALTGQAARWDLQPQADTDLRQLAQRMAELIAEPA